jgi:hypothetical protein
MPKSFKKFRENEYEDEWGDNEERYRDKKENKFKQRRENKKMKRNEKLANFNED